MLFRLMRLHATFEPCDIARSRISTAKIVLPAKLIASGGLTLQSAQVSSNYFTPQLVNYCQNI